MLFEICTHRNHDLIIDYLKFIQSQVFFKFFVPGLKYVKIFEEKVWTFENFIS